jgi:thiamine biosynthesis lipoprotein
MSTRVSVTLLAPSAEAAHEAIGRAFEEMDRVVPLLNRHCGDSAVSTLNDVGRLPDAPPELFDVLTESRRLYGLSHGAFDITVKPLVDLLRTQGGRPRREVLELVDMSALHVTDSSVSFDKSGMGLTLDGIAKGYVVDRMAEALVQMGMKRWLIDAGGDIRAAGRREDGLPWRVGVQDPQKVGPFPAITDLLGGAVATSGSYENYFTEDRTRHHIVDSGTGRSPVTLESATVTAPTAMMADALATTVFVLSPFEAAGLIERIPGCACLLLDSDGTQVASRTWNNVSTPTN